MHVASHMLGESPQHELGPPTHRLRVGYRSLIINNFPFVKVGAWIPRHYHHLLIQSHAKTGKGMPPKGAPKTISTGQSSDTVEQATTCTATATIQGLKVEFLILEEMALLVASCEIQEWLAPMYLGAPLGLHNRNVKFIVNKHREDYQNPFT